MVGQQKTKRAMMTEQNQIPTVPRLWRGPIATQRVVEGKTNSSGSSWKRALLTVANATAGEQQRTGGF